MRQRALSSVEHVPDILPNTIKDLFARAEDFRKLLDPSSDIRSVVQPEFQVSHGRVTSHFFSYLLLLRLRTPGMEFPEPETDALAKARALVSSESMI